MTTVTINEKWRVRIDEFNHTLERYLEGGNVITSGTKKGQISEPSWTLQGYYPNLSQCLRAVVRVEATALPDTDLNGYLTRLERLQEEIKV
jgi:hypothetical protein